MEIKKHFKLYKDGKKWCCAAIATAALGAGLVMSSPNVLADADSATSTSDVNNSLVKSESLNNTNNSESNSTNTNENSTDTISDNKNVDSNQLDQGQADSNNSEKQTSPVNVKAVNTDNKESVPEKSTPNTFKDINGSTYYYGENGDLYRNQFYNNWGHTYYFQADGARLDNGFYNNWGRTYYFGADGARWDNKFYNNWGHTYYFQGDGSRLDNGFYNNWGHTYYFGADGARWDNRYMVKWGRAYYFGNDGALLQNQYRSINGINYWINNEGVIPLKNQFLTANENQLFYFDGNGSLVVNKFYHNWGHTYYFGADGARYTDQFLNRDGKVYYFDNQGIMYQDQYYKNWGHTYYFGANGARYTNQFLNKDGKLYYFDNDGIMYQDQYYRNWGHTYYFGADGARYTNQFLNKDGKLYYFDNDGIMYQDQYYRNWGNTYYFGTDGARYTNQFLTKDGHQYYFDNDGVMVANQVRVIDGKGYEFNANGEATETSDMGQTRDAVAKEVAQVLTNQGLKGVKYDWRNTSNDYQELALHDIAQEVAQGDTNADKNVIEKKLQANSLLNGKVLVVYSTDFTNADPQKVTNSFINSFDFTNADNSVLGVGADLNKNKLVIILFKPGEKAEQPQATSTISASIIDVFKKAGVNVDVDNGLTKGSVVDSADLGNALANGTSALLKGDKGTTISQDVLKAIFAAFAGNTSAVEGTKNYYNGKDAYHYEFWLAGQSADDKLNNFLALNKDAKYGDQLKVNYTATLVYGTEKGSNTESLDKTPSSKKANDEIALAYQDGTETGARYETVKVNPIPNMKEDTIRGVDVSSYIALVKNGVQFYDFNGQPADLMKVLADAGVNYIRIRLWVDPYNAAGETYGGGIDDEATALQIAKDAKKYGMKVYLGVQYSDFWADPATQIIPKAWRELSHNDLKQEVYLYTRKIVNDFNNAGISIDMAQLGNEITKGFLGVRMGEGDIHVWDRDPYATNLSELLKAASQGFRDSSKETKLSIHIESLDVNNDNLILSSLQNHGVDYDIFAVSYYPFWGWGDDTLNWGSNPTTLAKIEQLAKNYDKKFMVAECGWPFTLQNSDGTANNISSDPGHYSVSPQGQVDEISEMYKTLLNNDNGLGAFYWEPAWIPVKAGWNNWEYNKLMGDLKGTGWASMNSRGYYPDSKLIYDGKSATGGSSWDNITLFDDHGYPLQSLLMYKGFLNGYESPANVTSSVNAKISTLYKTDGIELTNPLKIGDALPQSDVLNESGMSLLNGIQNTDINQASLKAIFNNLQDGFKSETFVDKEGNKYHYEFWLEGNNPSEKLANFLKQNQNAKYGNPLVVNYSATLILDNKNVENVTSPIKATISKVWGLDGVTISNPLSAGDSLPEADLVTIQQKVESILTGEKGTTIDTKVFDKLAKVLPGQYGVTGALKGQKVYTLEDGNQYHYEYWLTNDSIQDLNKDAKYGDPINISYTASLKWIDPAAK